MSWVFLFGAGMMEVLGVIAMKKFALTGRAFWLAFIAGFFVISLTLLSRAMEGIAMGTAYAIWTGIGAGGGVVVGILFFGESRAVKKIALIAVILACSVALKYLS